MRLSVALGCLLLVGCAGPHSTGALWAQQNLEQEAAMYRLSDAQRADRAQAFEHSLADETLAVERARIEAGLQDCPGPDTDRQPLVVSIGDRSRDTARIQAQDDPARLSSIAQVALADWSLRRARATGEAHFCDDARQALAGTLGLAAASDVLTEAGMAIVTRDPSRAVAAAEPLPANVLLSNYALGYIDTVQAMAPLPQYLAAVYGGVLLAAGTPPMSNSATPESLVDRFAPAYPEWEPDALYAALVAK
jgi:hypothetical protein